MGEMQPIMIRLCRVQEVFDLSEDTIRRYADKKEIEISKVGGMSFVDVAEVKAWIKKRRPSSG